MKKNITIACIIAVLAVLCWIFFFYGDERTRVLQQFNDILDAVEKTPGEGNIAMATSFQAVSNRVADTIDVLCFSPSYSEHANSDELMSQFAIGRKYCRSIHISTSSVDITLTDETHARLTCRGSARIAFTNYPDIYEDTKSVEVLFVKPKDKWLVYSVKEIRDR